MSDLTVRFRERTQVSSQTFSTAEVIGIRSFRGGSLRWQRA